MQRFHIAATAESNPFGTKIENNSNLTTLLSLTDAEVAQGVNVWLDIQDMSASVPQTDKTLIQNTSGDYTVGLYLDINLFKKVGSNDATKVTETNGKVKASIVIPESLWKSDVYMMAWLQLSRALTMKIHMYSHLKQISFQHML